MGDPNAPRRPLTPYIRFCNKNRKAVARKCEKSTQVISELAKRWRACSESEKAKLQAAYEKESVAFKKSFDRYKKTANYSNYRAALKKKALRRAQIAARKAAPKQPANGYSLFFGEFAQRRGQRNKSLGERAKACGVEWKNLDAGKKQKYNDRAKKAHAVYAKKLATYKNTKSYADHKNKIDTLTGAKAKRVAAEKAKAARARARSRSAAARKRAATKRAAARKRRATAAKKKAAAKKRSAAKRAAVRKRKVLAAKKRKATAAKKAAAKRAAAAKKRTAAAKKKKAAAKRRAAKRASKKRRATKKRRK